jgi:hypothetical protein
LRSLGRLAINAKAVRVQPIAVADRSEGRVPVPENVVAANALADAAVQKARDIASDRARSLNLSRWRTLITTSSLYER